MSDLSETIADRDVGGTRISGSEFIAPKSIVGGALCVTRIGQIMYAPMQ